MKKLKFLSVLLLSVSFSASVSAFCIIGDIDIPNGFFRAHHTIFSKYFECVEGYWTERECPEGLWFNPSTSACDFPWNVAFPGGGL